MSSLSRVLAAPALQVAPRAVADATGVLDPQVVALIQQAEARGRQAGYAAGAAEARQQAAADANRRLQGLQQALGELSGVVERARVEYAASVIPLAERIAAAVIDREPSDGARALLVRLRRLLAEFGDAQVRLAVAPDDAAIVREAVDGAAVVMQDGALQPGEARATVGWTRVELTRDAAWEAVREVLADADAVAADLPDEEAVCEVLADADAVAADQPGGEAVCEVLADADAVAADQPGGEAVCEVLADADAVAAEGGAA